MKLSLWLLCSCLTLCLQLPAQEEEEELWDPLARGLTPEGDLYPVKWKVNAKGQPLISPCPSSGDIGFGTMFHRHDLRSYLRYSRHLGSVGLFRVLFMGDRDFLSLADAEYHFRKLGLDSNDVHIRHQIVLEAEAESGALQTRAELDRLLAVRIAQRRKMKSARGELQTVAADADTDQLLRWAAEDALIEITEGGYQPAADRRKRHPAVEETLASIPDAYDLICRIDQTRIPPLRRLGRFARSGMMRLHLDSVRQAGGIAPPTVWAGAQYLSDLGTILPYELCRRLGNFRIARVTAALLFEDGESTPRFWFRFDGRFDAERIALVLEEEGFDSKVEKGTALATIPGLGLQIKVAGNHVILHSASYPLARRGKHAQALATAGFAGRQALWAKVLHGKRLRTFLDRAKIDLPAFETATLTFTIDPDGKLELRAVFPEEKPAGALARWLEEKIDYLSSKSEPSGQRAFDEFKKGLKIGSSKNVMTITWAPDGITFDSVLEAMRGK